MKLSYIIDTDWIIHYLNGNDSIVKKLTSLKKDGLGISIISLAELYEGIYISTNPAGNEKALNDFLRDIIVFGIDDNLCRTFGKLRSDLRKNKLLIDDFYLLIASTAIAHGLTLLSNNRKHYERIDGLEIISI